MSFSSLPPELVHQIIESTVPHTFHTETYKERQATLCRLSLVSKLFRSIAQPLLVKIRYFEHFVEGKNPSTFSGSENGLPRSTDIRWLVIREEEEQAKDPKKTQEEEDEYAQGLQVFATATHLTIAFVAQRTFETLIPMISHHLRYLQISDLQVEEPKNIYLPNLSDLTLYDVSPGFLHTLLSPNVVPTLRNFGFVGASPGHAKWLRDSGLKKLLPQLETIVLNQNVWMVSEARFLHSAATRTLVNLGYCKPELLSSLLSNVVHVRFDTSSTRNLDRDHLFIARFDKCASFIQNVSSSMLRSIYLDISCQYIQSLPSAVKNSLDNLTRICQARNVDIVYERMPSIYYLDPYISKDFKIRQIERKTREVNEGGIVRV